MTRAVFAALLLSVALSDNFARAQSPAVGQLPLPGDIYGYSPLVPTVDPFPTRSSGYASSWFLPRIGGKRIYPARYAAQLPPEVVVIPGSVVAADGPAIVVGPVQSAPPARAWHRFGRHSRSANQLP